MSDAPLPDPAELIPEAYAALTRAPDQSPLQAVGPLRVGVWVEAGAWLHVAPAPKLRAELRRIEIAVGTNPQAPYLLALDLQPDGVERDLPAEGINLSLAGLDWTPPTGDTPGVPLRVALRWTSSGYRLSDNHAARSEVWIRSLVSAQPGARRGPDGRPL